LFIFEISVRTTNGNIFGFNGRSQSFDLASGQGGGEHGRRLPHWKNRSVRQIAQPNGAARWSLATSLEFNKETCVPSFG
jgi:hypothetical protein